MLPCIFLMAERYSMAKLPSNCLSWRINIPLTTKVSLTILVWEFYNAMHNKIDIYSLRFWVTIESSVGSVFLKAYFNMIKEYVMRSLFFSFLILSSTTPKMASRYSSNLLWRMKESVESVFITPTFTLMLFDWYCLIKFLMICG